MALLWAFLWCLHMCCMCERVCFQRESSEASWLARVHKPAPFPEASHSTFVSKSCVAVLPKQPSNPLPRMTSLLVAPQVSWRQWKKPSSKSHGRKLLYPQRLGKSSIHISLRTAPPVLYSCFSLGRTCLGANAPPN